MTSNGETTMSEDLPFGPGTPGYVGEDDVDRQASAEGSKMKRAFRSSHGLAVVETVYKIAGVGKTNGRTEQKPEDARIARREARREMIRRIRENNEGE